MFLREAQAIHQSDLGKPFLGILPLIDKPTDPGITFAIASMWATYLDDGQVKPSGLFDVHVLPPADAHRMLFCIGSIPDMVRIRLSRRIRELEFGPIFARLSRFVSMGRGGLIKTAVALQ